MIAIELNMFSDQAIGQPEIQWLGCKNHQADDKLSVSAENCAIRFSRTFCFDVT